MSIDAFKGRTPLTKLIVLRGGTYFLLSIDAFKGRTPFTMLMVLRGGAYLLCQLMLSRGGPL